MFPSSRRRYVRAPPRYVYEYILHILREEIGVNEEEIKPLDRSTLKISLGGRIGVGLTVEISQEGEISLLSLRFRYRRILLSAALLLIAAVGLSLLFGSPLVLLIAAAILPIAYHASLEAVRFLDVLNETLPFLEEEYSRRALIKDRERWKKHLSRVQEIYEKLLKRHIDIWGNANVLKYKIEDYQSKGLTYEEAIIRIAEEEGVITEKREV
jgi:hypothetical protein